MGRASSNPPSTHWTRSAFGIHNEPEERLRRFVGPPLHQSFMEFYGFSQEQAFAAVEKYRERYRVKGVYENRLYPGVRALVEGLSRRAKVCLATSKPEVFARKILEMQHVLPCFDVVVAILTWWWARSWMAPARTRRRSSRRC